MTNEGELYRLGQTDDKAIGVLHRRVALHGQKESSRTTRVLTSLIHVGCLAAGGWIYFGSGAEILLGPFGIEINPGDPIRRTVLFAFGGILLLRMTYALFVLLKRKFGWDEMGGVVFAIFVYQVGFALLGATETSALGLPDGAAVAIFLFGSFLNTTSEYQRKRFKDKPENEGKLYTGGLFRFARHINYLGDSLWVTGWALMTRHPWALLVPISLTCAFVLAFIPSLTKHLRSRYGGQYERWARNTKRLIPYVY